MHIAIYSGSFNPIHKGHILLAAHILQHTDIEQVWFVVSPNNPLKERHTLMDENKRLQLVQAAIADYEQATQQSGGMIASDVEFTLPRPSYTVSTLRHLTAHYPEHRFSLVIGSDNMACFSQWKDWEYILAHYPILVYPRKGDDMAQLQAAYPQMQVLHDAPLFNVSSTAIRQMLQAGQDISACVYPSVAKALANRG